MRACAPVPVLHHHPGCHCPPNSTGTPPTHPLALCHYHYPSPIDSKSTFCSKPYQTGMFSKNFDVFFFNFSALGLHPPHPHHPPNLPGLWPHLRTLLCTSALPFVHLCAPCAPFAHHCAPLHSLCAPFTHIRAPLCTFPCTFAHLCTPFAHLLRTFRAPMRTLRSIFRVCHPYPTFFLTLDPLPATMGNPPLSQPGLVPTSTPLYNQVQPLQPPCCPSIFPVGLHNPHSHSRTRCKR